MTPGTVLCADIGGSFIRVGRAVDGVLAGDPVTLPTPALVWADFVAALAALVEGPAVIPLAVAIAGVVREDGQVLAANLPCLAGRHLATELSSALGRRVTVANDADCFALAEAASGAGAGHRVVLGIILGTGVGGGLVVDGRMVPGAGEWGHGPLIHAGPLASLPCGCGQRGCVDTIGSARGLERLHRALAGVERDSRWLMQGWLDGDAACAATLAAYVAAVADPLAFAVNVTAASVVPVGGGLGSVPALVAALDDAVRRRILRRLDRPLLVPSRHGGVAGLIGGALLAGMNAA